jgi:hypothetical protein
MALLVAACSSPSSPDPAARQPAAPSSSPAPSAPAKPKPCGPGAKAFWLPGPEDTKLEANSFGHGATAAVFLHEAGGAADMCGFWPFAKWLAVHRHVRVVLFNRCIYGRSTCQVFQRGDDGIIGEVQPAVDWARQHGARHVTLVGASSGASDALQAAGVVRHVDALVDLSGDSPDTGANDLVDARRVHVPALFAVAPGDRYASSARVKDVYHATPARTKRLVIVRDAPGTHGWDLLYDYETGSFTPLAHLVAEWVAGRRA